MISIARPVVNINFTMKTCVNVNSQILVQNKTCQNIIQVPLTPIYTYTDRFTFIAITAHTEDGPAEDYNVHKVPPYIPILSDRSLVHTPRSHSYNNYFNIMLPPMLMPSKQSPSFRIPTLYTFLPSCMSYMFCSTNFPCFHHLSYKLLHNTLTTNQIFYIHYTQCKNECKYNMGNTSAIHGATKTNTQE